MSDLTKVALGNALKEMLRTKHLEKITIQELTDICGINRMTFYYHFHDIYELAEWALSREVQSVLIGEVTPDNWDKALKGIFGLLKKDKQLFTNLYTASTRGIMYPYIGDMTEKIIRVLVHYVAAGRNLSKSDEDFIVAFYRYATLGLIGEWINDGMKDDPDGIIQKIRTLVGADASAGIERFIQE